MCIVHKVDANVASLFDSLFYLTLALTSILIKFTSAITSLYRLFPFIHLYAFSNYLKQFYSSSLSLSLSDSILNVSFFMCLAWFLGSCWILHTNKSIVWLLMSFVTFRLSEFTNIIQWVLGFILLTAQKKITQWNTVCYSWCNKVNCIYERLFVDTIR